MTPLSWLVIYVFGAIVWAGVSGMLHDTTYGQFSERKWIEKQLWLTLVWPLATAVAVVSLVPKLRESFVRTWLPERPELPPDTERLEIENGDDLR